MADATPKKTLANDYHVFTHDSEFLKQLNLDTFTTGTWAEFWFTQNQVQDGYMLRRLFLDENEARIDWPDNENNNFNPFLQRSVTPDNLGDFPPPSKAKDDFRAVAQMEAWRFQDDNKGTFELIKEIDGLNTAWSWEDPRAEIEWGGFNWSELDITRFEGKRVEAKPDDGMPEFHDMKAQDFNGDDIKIDLGILSSIPAMNDYVRIKELKDNKLSEWDDKDLAAREFIEDIKTSRSGCLSIPVSIFCDIKPARKDLVQNDPDSGPCSIREDFTITLHLKDALDDPDKQQASFALPSLKKVGIKRDSTGRPHGGKVDGDVASPNESDEGTHVAADVDLYYNEYTGSYQSGNKTILAKITKTVPSAGPDGHDVEALMASTVVTTLAEADENYLQMGTGEAMPITMQNGNPFQWTPNYARPADCRGEDTTKQTVIVFNADPDKSFSVGKTVLLHEIDGKWFPVEFGSGESEEFVPEPVFKGRWEFQQFLTNAGNFFGLRKNGNHSFGIESAPYGNPSTDIDMFSPEQYEKHFHRLYYFDDPYNNGDDTDPVKYAGSLVVENDIDISNLRQVTGFDYLENKLGGTRGEKRSINKTVYGQYGDASEINTEGGAASPDNTVYFGAVFPDGYTALNQGENDEIGPQLYQGQTRTFNVRKFSQDADSKTRFFTEFDGDEAVFPTTKEEDHNRTAYTRDGRSWGDPDNASYKVCIFGEQLEAGNSTYSHLPADYATHCSPSGIYGRPIMDLNYLNFLGHSQGSLLRNQVSVAFGADWTIDNDIVTDKNKKAEGDEFGGSMFHWLYRQPTDGWAKEGDDPLNQKYLAHYTQSAFDFRPIRPNHVQFRPCQMELFSNHQNDDGQFVPANTVSNSPSIGDNPNRSTIINYLSNKMDDNKTALSFNSIEVQKNIYQPDGSVERDNAIFSEYGKTNFYLKDTYGQLIHGTDFSSVYYSKFHNTTRFGLHNRNPPFDFRKEQDGGLLGVGVIGSVCTVGATQAVGFTTQQAIGMQSIFLNSNWLPVWGGSSYNRYDKFGTTDLSVRIYQAHERDNLIYDSRFFAVHHFNAGTRVNLGAGKWSEVDTDGDSKLDCKVMHPLSSVDIAVPSYVEYKDDCVFTNADPQVPPLNPSRSPTSAAATSVNQYKHNDSDIIYRDSVQDDATGGWHRLLPSGFWNVDSRRRGRLLPFNYEAVVMQSPYFSWGGNARDAANPTFNKVWVSSERIDNYDQIDNVFLIAGRTSPYALEIKDPADQTKYIANEQPVSDVDLVIRNLGKDYKVGDRLKITGFEASEVTITSTGTGGCVTGLTFNIDPDRRSDFETLGTSVDPNYLVSASPEFEVPKLTCDYTANDPRGNTTSNITKMSKSSSGGAKLKPFNAFSVSGKGFDAFVTKAVLRKYLKTDFKPKIATISNFYQLSLPADNSPGGPAGANPLGAILQLFGLGTNNASNFIPMTNGSRTVQADLLPQNASPSGLYDCFFHFHNDIQHTVLNNDNVNSAHKSNDQYIDLTINPL